MCATDGDGRGITLPVLCLCCCRCEDLDAKTRAKAQYHIPLLVIPGPAQPADLDIYFELIGNDFKSAGPDGEVLILCR